ncbi:hypothetical protein TEHN7128_1517 [Tetragenococcus halophilus subsp. halophilus]|uniref:Uncharacterized protein n=2 Tax=Tetragenococcus halophilus TaxID=51669 RepID=A0A2H6CSX8_TETHA|nr:hypothetical protein [Tetragenococcus halophilus]MCO8285290.1 hypothetical protein [Tetragenococcus halophilus]MCO8297979.1 hypothetical protein [Tetragenococcus halophilus]GBD66871.1 hypothetical protein TEHN7116_1835 [Tetragenococcus halophilus subsp. halophilus]GBD68095.1 hypothetical protein TEHN7118_0901 [Tetragenococcus halophilus subsp. halophilus]GBD78288.1 hypothetical protein TEHN7128_1517 [Tetragenococcus halophilus subsp. halophilus]
MKRASYSPIIKGASLILLLFIIQIVTNLIYNQPVLANFENFVFIGALYIVPYILSFTKWNLFYQFLIFLLISFGYFTATSFLDNSYVDYSTALLLLAISVFAALVMVFFSLIIRQRRAK